MAELSAALTVDELAHWIALNQQCPVGDERFDYLFANLCANLVSASGAKRKGGGSFALRDFMVFAKPAPEPTPRQFVSGLIGHLTVQKRKPGT